MTGIQYLTDEAGHPTSVLIDLKEWGELWEDFYDGMIAEERKNEPLTDWKEVKRRLDNQNEVSN
jgi:hypothetical protein